jgi:hypothetical protein
MSKTRPALNVHYDTGETDTVRLRPEALVAAERHFGAEMPPNEGALYAAWVTLHKPLGNFDAWLSKVDEIEEVEVPAHSAPAGDDLGEAAAAQ